VVEPVAAIPIPLEAPARPRFRLHLDPVGGMAGDMFLGACLDLGVPLPVVADAVAALGLQGVAVEAFRAARGGREGTRFRVLVEGESLEGPEPGEAGGGRGPELVTTADWDLEGLLGLLAASALDEAVAERASRLFRRLAGALARAEGTALTAVRFSGAPGLDFLVDLVGAAAAVEHLLPAEGRVTCGPVFVGGPEEEGRRVPPLVVTDLLAGAGGLAAVPLVREAGAGECLTPTGAVLLAELVDGFAAGVELEVEAEGWGLGRREVVGRVNGVRVLVGRG
jgi:hypothetical protein